MSNTKPNSCFSLNNKLLPTLAVTMALILPLPVSAITISRVSVANGGSQISSGKTVVGGISAYARFVVFDSAADNLVDGDSNFSGDVFLRDRSKKTTERVSVATDGSQGNGESKGGVISANGRFIAFWSKSDNLVPDDSNGLWDVFVHDRAQKTTSRITVAESHADDRLAISGDGRLVVFSSTAQNVVAGDTDNINDIFVYDRQTQAIQRIARWGGQDGDSFEPAISADGRRVAFRMNANLFGLGLRDHIFVHNLSTHVLDVASLGITVGSNRAPALSGDGNIVVFTNDHGIDNGGMVVAYNLADAHLTEVALGDVTDSKPAISADGHIIAFQSETPLIRNDSNGVADIYLYDLPARSLVGRANRTQDNKQDNGVCGAVVGTCRGGALGNAYLSAHGRGVAFSTLGGLVSDDTNQTYDAYVRVMHLW